MNIIIKKEFVFAPVFPGKDEPVTHSSRYMAVRAQEANLGMTILKWFDPPLDRRPSLTLFK